MTGPEHYRAAEEILASCKDADADADPRDVALLLQFASLHATLALAAATALNPAGEGGDHCWSEYGTWAEVCAVKRPVAEDSASDAEELLRQAAAPLVPTDGAS